MILDFLCGLQSVLSRRRQSAFMDVSLPVFHRELRAIFLNESRRVHLRDQGVLIYNPDRRPVVYCLEEGRVEERRTSVRPAEEGEGGRRSEEVGVCCVRDWPC